MTNYKIVEAHSGNDEKEIAKAKRHYRAMKNAGRVFGIHEGEEVTIRFTDVNYCIVAHFENEIGDEICNSVQVN